MELSKQVCSWELAERLRELGVKQKSYWQWARSNYSGDYILINPHYQRAREAAELSDEPGRMDVYKPIAAFTVADLGEMLPQSMRSRDGLCNSEDAADFVSIHSSGKGWRAGYMCRGCAHFKKDLKSEQCATEADARAKMLIYLLENSLTA